MNLVINVYPLYFLDAKDTIYYGIMYKDKWFIVSKIYMEYLKRKKIDSDKYYLFKSGLFYIFIDEDAKYISSVNAKSA